MNEKDLSLTLPFVRGRGSTAPLLTKEGTKGRLYGVGVGPGDPELISLKGHRILKSSPVIAYPARSAEEEPFALGIITQYLDQKQQELLRLIFPMKKDPEYLKPFWEEAANQVHSRLMNGQNVVFITEGDPFLYSTFIYLYRELKNIDPEAAIEIVPGINSFSAASGRALMPLVETDDKLAVIPAGYGTDVIRSALNDFDTVVLMKVKPVSDEVIDLLKELELLDHVVFVSKVGTLEEQIVTNVINLKGQKVEYLSLMIIKNPNRVKEPVKRGCTKR